MPPKNVIGTLHQQAAEVDVPSLGDTELRISLSGLTPFRPQAEIATHIATSLETFFASQGQDIGQRRELANPIDLEKRLCLAIFRLNQLLERVMVLFDLHRHACDLLTRRGTLPIQTQLNCPNSRTRLRQTSDAYDSSTKTNQATHKWSVIRN